MGGGAGGEFPAGSGGEMFFSDSTTTTVIDRTVEPCALFLRAESAETETGGPISGEVCSVSVALGAVGLSVCRGAAA